MYCVNALSTIWTAFATLFHDIALNAAIGNVNFFLESQKTSLILSSWESYRLSYDECFNETVLPWNPIVLRWDVPTQISSDRHRLDIDPTRKCRIDK